MVAAAPGPVFLSAPVTTVSLDDEEALDSADVLPVLSLPGEDCGLCAPGVEGEAVADEGGGDGGAVWAL